LINSVRFSCYNTLCLRWL